MELATYRLRIGDDDLNVIERIVARLDQESAPQVMATPEGGSVTFTCDTWRPILVTRVDDAIAAELGADQQAFAPS